MPKKCKVAARLLLLISLGAVHSALAQSTDDLGAIRAEIEALKADNAARVAGLEARITQLESQLTANARAVATIPESSEVVPAPAATASSAAAFNPSISMILSGRYARLSQAPQTYQIAGFRPAGEGVGPGERSFTVGESELTVAANVDPYFFANVTASISGEDTIGVEEAYVKTIALPSGLSLKAGRFFSGIGYLNEIHAHAWDFTDQPLVYQAFLNGQFAQDGVQLKWLAPTDRFVEFGVESGNSRGFPAVIQDRNGPNNTALFVHTGGDIGDSINWRGGGAWLDSRDDSRTWVADLTFKWAPQGNMTQRQLKVQGEYFSRTRRGAAAFDPVELDPPGQFRGRQSGWYLQSVYQFLPQWRAGARYDSLDAGRGSVGAAPHRATLMLDWNPSEFTRIRAQYAWDDARATVRDRQLFLQYLYSIGAHGAHKF